jgi:8-oxo-dGTP pyrophosphatase MutT (NUDIX family)
MEHESSSTDYSGQGACQHLFASNSNGSGTGRVEVWCVRCGAQEIYYDDTGTVLYSELDPDFDNSRYTGVIHSIEELNDSIHGSHFCERFADERNVCLVCGKQLEPKKQEPPSAPPVPKAAPAEKLYIVKKTKRGYEICGLEERSVAEQKGLRHLTVIIVPFVASGPEEGRWIVHDRTAKLWAKKKAAGATASLNLFGGHCSAGEEASSRIGTLVTMDIFDAAAERELEEELLRRGTGHKLEVWDNNQGASDSREAAKYAHLPLIPVGIVTYSSASNCEASYLYALPVPAADVDALIAADNYTRGGEERDIALPILRMRENELKKLHRKNPTVEICDAISRLWLCKNRSARRKLQRAIRAYCKDPKTRK